jgi:hypothetical protein
MIATTAIHPRASAASDSTSRLRRRQAATSPTAARTSVGTMTASAARRTTSSAGTLARAALPSVASVAVELACSGSPEPIQSRPSHSAGGSTTAIAASARRRGSRSQT